ncbi:MAG: hypothetical protein M3037_01105 [Gemmatimonadota bacterium]|nr:hypothetical protein [Gemmatimonadota bacterium]
MNSHLSLKTSLVIVGFFAVSAASGCNRANDKAVKGRTGPNGAGHDSVSEVALNEDGLGPVQIGMTLAEAVNMGLLNENPNMKKECDFVFPAVGAGIPDNVGVMIVKGKVARIDVDTGSVTTEDGAKIGDTEDKIKSIYSGDVQLEPHKYIPGGHYMIVMGDSTSAGKAIVFETNGKVVTNFRAGRLPEVKWVEGCS